MKLIIKIILISFLLSCEFATEGFLWPYGKIYYVPLGFNAEEISVIHKCMIEWETMSGGAVEFVLGETDDINTLYILSSDMDNGFSCFSSGVGYDPHGSNFIIINIFKERYILHEIGHILGLEHEHSRPDRDKYITIQWENIPDNFYPDNFYYRYQFKYEIPEFYNYYEYPYDYKSIMHYSIDDVGDCIDFHGHEDDTRIGKVSLIDGMKVKDMYPGFF